MIWIILLLMIALVVIVGTLFLNSKPFGKAPSGERLERFSKVKYYHDGAFRNIEETPMLADDASYTKILFEFFFKSSRRKSPKTALPTVKTDLKALATISDVLIWFGHSSYFMQIDGIRILVDPVFSGSASPVPGSVKAFPGTDIYSALDMPEIDLLLITHDHYDHLDYETIVALKPKVKQVITSLGCGSHLEYWGYDASLITELNWEESIDFNENLKLTALPARHFGGRGLNRGNTFWSAFLMESDALSIFVGGDSGYGKHFKQIGNAHPGIDLAILENGQYDVKWPLIHMQPDEVILAIKDLGAKRLLPVHSGKFPLANHDWDEPLKRIYDASGKAGIPLLTPRIGEIIRLNDADQSFDAWWVGID